jgi:uncharacterized protein (DUF1778 family)
MPKKATREARLNFRLPAELKQVIAAAHLGQSVSDHAVSTLVQNARGVVQQHDVTVLSNRDRDVFLALLDDADAKPNKAQRDAAAKYKKHLGKRNGGCTGSSNVSPACTSTFTSALRRSPTHRASFTCRCR